MREVRKAEMIAMTARLNESESKLAQSQAKNGELKATVKAKSEELFVSKQKLSAAEASNTSLQADNKALNDKCRGYVRNEAMLNDKVARCARV